LHSGLRRKSRNQTAILRRRQASAPAHQEKTIWSRLVVATTCLPTIAVCLITEAEQAEAIIANGEADAVSPAGAMLYGTCSRG